MADYAKRTTSRDGVAGEGGGVAADASPRRMTRDVPWSPLPFLGILAFRLTAYTVYGNEFTTTAVDAYALSRLVQLAVTVACVVISLAAAVSNRARRAFIAASTVVMVACGVVSIAFDPTSALFGIGRILHGAGSAVLLLGWGVYTCSIRPRRAVVYVSGAFALYGVATVALNGAPSAVTQWLAVLAPLVCGGLLLACIRTVPDQPSLVGRGARTAGEGFGSHFRRAVQGVPLAILWLLVACSLICTVTGLVIAPSQDALVLYTTNVFRLPMFLAVAVAFCVLVFMFKSDDPDQFWPLYAVVIFLGLLGYSSFAFVDEATSVNFMRATQDCLMMFAWIFASGLAWRGDLPRVTTFGLGVIVLMRTDFLSGLVRLVLPGFSGEAATPLTVALSFLMALALILYTVILINRYPIRLRATAGAGSDAGAGASAGGFGAGDADAAGRRGAASSPLRGDPNGESQADWLAAFGLSAREEQIVGLLLHGYTLSQVGERLNISLNTVRWHTKGAYGKLGIHSKKELVELAEQSRRLHEG